MQISTEKWRLYIFKKTVEILKLKNTIIEMKNSLGSTIDWRWLKTESLNLQTDEEKSFNLKREKRLKKNQQGLGDLRGNIERSKNYVIGVPEGEKGER